LHMFQPGSSSGALLQIYKFYWLHSTLNGGVQSL
jgi:hypothetical protein